MDALTNLKLAIINSFFEFQLGLENGRSIKDYEYIKEAISLENHISLFTIDPKTMDSFIQKSTLNLRMNDL